VDRGWQLSRRTRRTTRGGGQREEEDNQRRRRGEDEEEDQATDIKSNNLHLAGGEKPIGRFSRATNCSGDYPKYPQIWSFHATEPFCLLVKPPHIVDLANDDMANPRYLQKLYTSICLKCL